MNENLAFAWIKPRFFPPPGQFGGGEMLEKVLRTSIKTIPRCAKKISLFSKKIHLPECTRITSPCFQRENRINFIWKSRQRVTNLRAVTFRDELILIWIKRLVFVFHSWIFHKIRAYWKGFAINRSERRLMAGRSSSGSRCYRSTRPSDRFLTCTDDLITRTTNELD